MSQAFTRGEGTGALSRQVIDADDVTEVAATESPPIKEESSIIFGKPEQRQNPWEVRQNSKILYWQSLH